MTHAIVLAGGQGQRLRPVVSAVPKPMAPIDGRPFLAYLLALLERQGVSDVILAVGYRGEAIAAAFGSRWGGLALRYAAEAEPLGTGGALRNALGLVEHFPVLALNGDTYLEFDLHDMLRAHATAHSRLTVAVRREENVGRFGTVALEGGRIVGFESAGVGLPGMINCGVYLFAENLLADPALAEKFSFENDFLARRARRLRPLAYEVSGYFIDIGVPADFLRAQRELPTLGAGHVARHP